MAATAGRPNLSVSRNKFRYYFQPSRIVLGVVKAPVASGWNVITLCFVTHCSYKPRMIAVAIQDNAASQQYFREADEFVLAVPGPSLLHETVVCGTTSAKDMDKISELGLELMKSEQVATPSLKAAIANVELRLEQTIQTGDHNLIVGRVVRFAINPWVQELPLVSIGPRTSGYKLLEHHGQHRIATIADC